jgi:hypothetical protein
MQVGTSSQTGRHRDLILPCNRCYHEDSMFHGI